jgi:hypothetical protein
MAGVRVTKRKKLQGRSLGMPQRYKFHATARGMKSSFQINHLQETAGQTANVLPEDLP